MVFVFYPPFEHFGSKDHVVDETSIETEKNKELGGAHSIEDEIDRRAIEVGDILVKKLRDAKLNDLVLTITSLALVLIGVSQAVVAWENYHDTTPLVGYARDNTAAAQKFAASAEQINNGVGQAVRELGTQATKLDDSVQQAKRLAKDTEVANDNALEADRPWMGVTIQVSDFQVGKVPNVLCLAVNSGRRPALIQSFHCAASLQKVFPDPPSYPPRRDPKGLAVPGALISGTFSFTQASDAFGNAIFEPLTQEHIASIGSPDMTIFVYAELKYIDIRTQKNHFTHSCVQYASATTGGTPAGFVACSVYNDTDQ